jgi:5-methylcytosine-specific restriction endonuclease McrA
MNQSIQPALPPDEPETVEQLISFLRALRSQRASRKIAQRRLGRWRRSLSTADRELIHAKTAGLCHICGGRLEERWQADHVLAHSGGGGSEADNCLAAHTLCNNYRWDYLPQEFQIILKLGVWARTQIERNNTLGQQLASSFVTHEEARRRRRTRTETAANTGLNGTDTALSRDPAG